MASARLPGSTCRCPMCRARAVTTPHCALQRRRAERAVAPALLHQGTHQPFSVAASASCGPQATRLADLSRVPTTGGTPTLFPRKAPGVIPTTSVNRRLK
jgi:hypothetical protein